MTYLPASVWTGHACLQGKLRSSHSALNSPKVAYFEISKSAAVAPATVTDFCAALSFGCQTLTVYVPLSLNVHVVEAVDERLEHHRNAREDCFLNAFEGLLEADSMLGPGHAIQFGLVWVKP